MSTTEHHRQTGTLLLVVFGAMGFQVGAWALSLPAVVEELDLNVSQLGITLASMALAGCAATTVSGRIAERITVRLTLILSAAASGVGYLIMPMLHSFTAFTIGAVGTGVWLGMFDVAANAAGSLEELRRGKMLLSTLHATFSTAAASAAVLSYLLNGEAGYAPAFWTAGLVCIAGAGAALLLPVAIPPPLDKATQVDTSEGHDLAKVATAASILSFVIICGAFTIDTTMEGFSALFIDQLPGQGTAQSAFGLASLYLAAAISRAASTTVIKRLGDWRTLLIGLGIVVAGAVVLVWVATSWASVVGMLLIGIGLAPAAPIGYSIMGRSRANDVERATARLTTAGYGTFVLTPLVVSAVGSESLSDAFRLLPVMLAIMVLATAWFGYRTHTLGRSEAQEVTS
ncbi:MFS transporter [Streptomyces sp. NPDC020747]|uniref:MFS transporter n=1 Tax=Streptomyces sp. NPDC020747 TaxID=3365086 RepID=UPI00378D2EB4